MSPDAAPTPASLPFVLRGDRVGLRTLRREDAATVAPWFSDLDFLTCLTARALPMSLANEQEWFDQHVKNTNDSVQFAIVELATDRHVGNCGLFDFTRHNAATFGIGIGQPDARGKGLGTEATRLVAEYGLFFLNLHNIRLGVFAFNGRAIAAYRRAGYREAGRIRGAVCVAGVRYDEVLMDITRDDVDPSRMRQLVPALNGPPPTPSTEPA
jgi:RimJ/RimL family protein N-acetyltransferase